MKREWWSTSVKSLSISNCEHLSILEEESVTSLSTLESLSISNNSNLVYIHQKALHRLPRLKFLDLRMNNLSILENIW